MTAPQKQSVRRWAVALALLSIAGTAGAAPLSAEELRAMAGRQTMPALEAGNTASVRNDFAECVREMYAMAESAIEWGYPVQQLVNEPLERSEVLWVGDGAIVLACHAVGQRAEATFMRYANATKDGPVWIEPAQGVFANE